MIDRVTTNKYATVQLIMIGMATKKPAAPLSGMLQKYNCEFHVNQRQSAHHSTTI